MNDRDKELAKQAGLAKPYVSKTRCESGVVIKDIDALQKFADLIRDDATETANARANTSWALMCKKMVADEREACAKVADKYSEGQERNYSENIADEIRARGNT